MDHNAIEFKGVRKYYGEFPAVRQLDLQVGATEFLALLGPSGCGKSTILKMIAGIEDPSEGEIFVDNELVNYKLPRHRHVAMVFQNYALYPHMNVAKNIAYPLTTLKIAKPSKASIQERMRQAADIVEVVDQLDKYPSELSGGQRQRVALARAIIREPSVFLMDEPLSNLDALLRDSMRQQLISLHKRVGKATVYVTHDQLEAMTMADRIVVMSEGVIQQVGTPRQIFLKPANLFVAGFVGSPRMNLVSGAVCAPNRVRIGEHELATDAELGAAGMPVTIGLRPTDGEVGGSDCTVKGVVEATEFIGADCNVSIRCGENLILRLRHTANRIMKSGVEVDINFSPSSVHVFGENGTRL